MTPSASFKNEVTAPPEAKTAGLPMAQLLIAVGFAVILSVAIGGGAIFWLARSGHLPMPPASGAGPAAALPSPAASASAKTHPLVLEPILANLADSGGSAYLRVAITLRVADPPLAKGEKPKVEEKPEKGKTLDDQEAAVRDTALQVIGQSSAQQLLEANGKERLKQQLAAAIAKHVPELKVTEVFFTEFLVQQ